MSNHEPFLYPAACQVMPHRSPLFFCRVYHREYSPPFLVIDMKSHGGTGGHSPGGNVTIRALRGHALALAHRNELISIFPTVKG